MFSRRPGRGNRRGIGAATAAALAIPATISDGLLWFHADYTTNTGDGTAVTAAADQASTNTIGAAAAGGALYKSTAFCGGKACVEVGTNRGLIIVGTGNPVIDHLNNQAAATQKFTAITVWQPRHHLFCLPWAWGRAATSTHRIVCRTGSNTYKSEVYGGTNGGVPNGAQPTIAAPSIQAHPVPRVDIVRRINDGSEKLLYRTDGVNDGTGVAWSWVGTYVLDRFGIGVEKGPGETFSSAAYIRHVIIFNRALTDEECAEWEAYFGRESFAVNYKAGLGATGDWLIVAQLGQSNMVGYGTNDNVPYTFSASQSYYMALDGHVKPLVMACGDGADDASAVLSFATPTAANLAGAFCERLRALGETRTILVVPCAQISTDSVAWKAGLTSNPPTTTDLIGYAKHRIDDALKAPGASLVVMIDQGEANCDNLSEAQAWDNDWALILDELDTRYAGQYEKTCHHIVGRLSDPIAGVGANVADVRASQDALATARGGNMVLVQRPKGTDATDPGLHLNGPEQQAYGILMANAWDAAS